MTDNIINLSKRAENGFMQSPEDALKDALACIGKEGNFKNCKKLLILALDDTTGGYNTSFIQAGMKSSECMALCEVSKVVFLRQMGYIGE